MIGDRIGSDSATVTTFYPMTGRDSNTTEATVQTVSDSMTLKKIAIRLNNTPGAGKSRAFTLRVNGVDTALTCTVVDTNTGCSFAADVAVGNNDLLSTSDVPTGSPTTTSPTIAYLAVR